MFVFGSFQLNQNYFNLNQVVYPSGYAMIQVKTCSFGDHSKLNLNLNHSYPPLVMSWFKLKYVRFVRLNRSFIVILTCGMPWFKLKYVRFWLQLNQSHFNLNLFVYPSGYAMIQVKICLFWVHSIQSELF